jgi:hypothetical protein
MLEESTETPLMEERIAIALRVATCVQEHHVPARTDLESLQSWVDPSDRQRDPIEQACIVIIAELHRQKNSQEDANGAKA